MSLQTVFEEKVLDGVSFTLPRPGEHRICRHAQEFVEWCESLIRNTEQDPTDTQVSTALQSLQNRFFRVYEDAPAICLAHFGPEREYYCLFACYQDTYRTLREQAVTALTQRTLMPHNQQIMAIPLGEIEGSV